MKVSRRADRESVPTEASASSPLGAIALYLLARWRAAAHGLLFLAADERRAEHLGAMLYALDQGCDPMVLPSWDCLPYDDLAPSREIMGRRTCVLRRLATAARSPLLLATADAILQRVPARTVWKNRTFTLRPGMNTRMADLEAFLRAAGYDDDARVEEPGEFAIHGQVVDVFPAGALGPIRVDFHEGKIATLQIYDPASQRTTSEIGDVVLDVASELPFLDQWLGGEARTRSKRRLQGALESVLDYLPRAVLVADAGVERRGNAVLQQVWEAYEQRAVLPIVRADAPRLPPPKELYLDPALWRSAVGKRKCELSPNAVPEKLRVPKFVIAGAPKRALRTFVDEQLAAGRRIVLAAADDSGLKALERQARQAGLEPAIRVRDWDAAVRSQGRAPLSLRVDFDAGFVLPSLAVAVIAAPDVLGSRAPHVVPMRLRDGGRAPQHSLWPGDVVIHMKRGVGVLRGLETVSGTDVPARDMVRIEYAGGATVSVPVEELALVWRYGPGGAKVKLDRVDGRSWAKRRVAVEHELDDTASRLTVLVKQRAARTARKLIPPPAAYERFVARFPFFPTPDQASAAEDVLSDLASGHPMDRLVCGDVGFGKTEVALRAAAAAVLSGAQVAVVVPTTVLARQHFNTFRRRFAALDVGVGQLSRFGWADEIRSVKKGLADGSLRLVIGTHAIFATGVRFERLGLVIIDEEQRFGAREKLKMRSLANRLHVLTLTATPIPRTLQQAIVGLRDLSIIATPPRRRLPVRTEVAPFRPETVRHALLYERHRGGQSFFVCPRIEDIREIEHRLRQIAPELELHTVHGKMSASAIDDTMLRFAEGEGDVLLSTDIIESGLDLPRANTMLIFRPDRFGLAQLHQLRGRVGRGSRRGFAYLLTNPNAAKTKVAESRLRSVLDLNQLGAGFDISERDLDIRGAGDLLGPEQAGHVKLLGPDLYRHLLGRALERARGGEDDHDELPDVQLEISGSIPADYVRDDGIRLEIYSRIIRASTERDLDELEEEMEDRFGEIPAEVHRLLGVSSIRLVCRRNGIARIAAGPLGIAIEFRRCTRPSTLDLADLGATHWSENRLLVDKPTRIEERVAVVATLLARLENDNR
jgi:transcription-repair coupling factor (superfamily II helicase)